MRPRPEHLFPARARTVDGRRPARHHTRGVRGDEEQGLTLARVKAVVMNVAESVYPWAGLALGAFWKRNPVVRIGAPIAGGLIGIARAVMHTANAEKAQVLEATVVEEDPADVDDDGPAEG